MNERRHRHKRIDASKVSSLLPVALQDWIGLAITNAVQLEYSRASMQAPPDTMPSHRHPCGVTWQVFTIAPAADRL
jgi:hypothetical protein